jgi:hypothetical protein
MKTTYIYNQTLTTIHLKNLLILFAFSLLMTSCKKDEFPNPKQLQGTWTELNEQSFQHKLRFDNETLYFIKQNTVDTLIFRLDDKEEKMFLRLKSKHTEIETQHNVKINKQRDEITVWNLFITNTFETETTFRKD